MVVPMAWKSGLLALAMTAGAALAGPTAQANPAAGMELNDDTGSCTAGFAARGGDGRYYLLTSGHCNAGDGSQWADAGDAPLGRIVASENNGDDRDGAMILLEPAAGIPSGGVDHRYHIRDVLSGDQLLIGMPFCKVGARTGETCGTITDVDGNVVVTNLLSLEGDSGSPGFVMNPDGTVSAVGILMGGPDGDDYTTHFVLVDPLLRQWGLQILR